MKRLAILFAAPILLMALPAQAQRAPKSAPAAERATPKPKARPATRTKKRQAPPAPEPAPTETEAAPPQAVEPTPPVTPPPPPEPPRPPLTASAAPATPPADEPMREASAGGGDRVLLDLSAVTTLRSRHFSFTDGRSNNLRPYDVDGVPSIGGALEVFPFARSSSVLARAFGLTGDLQSAVGLRSRTTDGVEGRTLWTRYDAGLKLRFALAPGPKAAVVGVLAQYGNESFRFAESTSIGGQLPDVTYGFVRSGADLRAPIGPVAVRAQAAYLLVLESGGVGGRFRDASAHGVEGSLGVGVPLAGEIEARAGATYSRFFHAFSPAVGDRYVAGGALDQMFGGQLALALMLK